MSSSSTVHQNAPFAVVTVPGPVRAAQQLIWGHGWGQSSLSLLPLAESLRPFAPSSLIDFPGFGKTPIPAGVWGTAEYADQVDGWMRSLPPQRFIWVGHSFGGRVGLQLAARHPGLLAGMVLIASAGLQRQRTPLQRVRISVNRLLFRTAKLLLPQPQVDRLRGRMGSADYRDAGPMRSIFVRVIGEDLTDQARSVQCPTLLLYGKLDSETPPEIGRRLQALIPHSELVELPGFGHLDILTEGRHQVASRLRKFLELSHP